MKKLPEDLELFLKECRLSGYGVNLYPLEPDIYGYIFGPERSIIGGWDQKWLALGKYHRMHKIWGGGGALPGLSPRLFNTVDELLEAAQEEIQKW